MEVFLQIKEEMLRMNLEQAQLVDLERRLVKSQEKDLVRSRVKETQVFLLDEKLALTIPHLMNQHSNLPLIRVAEANGTDQMLSLV